MKPRPPKEGSRWGNDPAPATAPDPAGPPAEYIELCDRYGEPNVNKALEIFEKIKTDYPHLEVLNQGPLSFASDILFASKASMENAAEDGRSHTLPETLKICEDILGSFLAQNREPLRSIIITYGDENKGNKAKRKEEEKVQKAASWFLIISGLAGMIAFFATISETGSFITGIIAGIIVTVISFIVLAGLYHGATDQK